jgi:lipase chaperone LimK
MNDNQEQAIKAFNKLITRSMAALQRVASDQAATFGKAHQRLKAVGIVGPELPATYQEKIDAAKVVLIGMIQPDPTRAKQE